MIMAHIHGRFPDTDGSWIYLISPKVEGYQPCLMSKATQELRVGQTYLGALPSQKGCEALYNQNKYPTFIPRLEP